MPSSGRGTRRARYDPSAGSANGDASSDAHFAGSAGCGIDAMDAFLISGMPLQPRTSCRAASTFALVGRGGLALPFPARVAGGHLLDARR